MNYFEDFSEGNSFLHRADPRVKILLTVLYTCIISVQNNLTISLLGIFLPFCLLFFTRIRFKSILKRFLIVYIFVGILWIVLPLSGKGDPIFYIGPVKIFKEGLEKALLITVKFSAILFFIVGFISTTTVTNLFHALSHLKFPPKLSHLALLTYRYIHVLFMEFGKLKNAIIVRGFKPRTNLHTYRTYAYLVGMLLVRSYNRAERVYRAMLCRGFEGKFYLLDHFYLKKSDIVLAISVSSYILFIIFFGFKYPVSF